MSQDTDPVSLGRIIYMNGASSSGKTTVGRALQDALEKPYMLISVDALFEMLPARFSEEPSRDLMLSVISGMDHIVAALSETGNNVIADTVIAGKRLLRQSVSLLAHLPVLFVGVFCPLDELERRERERTDRDEGLARFQYERVHSGVIYDVEVDTHASTPAECAHQIIAALNNPQLPNAFSRNKAALEAEATG